MNRRTALALMALAPVAACATAPTNPTAPTAPVAGPVFEPGAADGEFPVTVAHVHGTTAIGRRPERVVALGYTDADAVLALGVQPVGINSGYNFDRGVGPWAQARLTGTPTVWKGREYNYEGIAALGPDLIVNVTGDDERPTHDLLSRIAPTIARPADARRGAVPWSTVTRTVASALGMPGEGERVVADTEGYLRGLAASHPRWSGRTLTYLDYYRTEVYAVSRDAATTVVTNALGFRPVPYIQDLATDKVQVAISNELVPRLDADVLIVYGFGASLAQMAADSPAIGSLPAIRDGRAFLLPDTALSSPTALSIPFAIDRMIPFLDQSTA